MNTKGKIIFAAGGTAGHLFPAIEVAHTFVDAQEKCGLLTDVPPDSLKNLSKHIEIERLPLKRPGASLVSRFLSYISLLWAGLKLVKRFKKGPPKLVLGFGGYASFPALFASWFLRIPYEMHEQNAYASRVNRLFLKRAKVLFLSFPKTFGVKEIYQHKSVYVGMPVRKEIKECRKSPYPTKHNPFKVLIIGGSQGARILSRILPDSLSLLPKSDRKTISVMQQARPEVLEETISHYKNIGIEAKVASFFTNMAEEICGTHLLIARAGASTCAEILVAGIPAILIPLPSAMDDHQTYNAKSLHEEYGLSWFSEKELTPQILKAKILYLMNNPHHLKEISDRLRKSPLLSPEEKIYTKSKEYFLETP